MKARIIERTHVDGTKKFVIQQPHFLFWWWWVDAWINDGSAWCTDSFDTLAEAQKNLCYFDDTRQVEKVIETH